MQLRQLHRLYYMYMMYRVTVGLCAMCQTSCKIPCHVALGHQISIGWYLVNELH